jgi:hypothetical protein
MSNKTVKCFRTKLTAFREGHDPHVVAPGLETVKHLCMLSEVGEGDQSILFALTQSAHVFGEVATELLILARKERLETERRLLIRHLDTHTTH